MIIAPSVLSVVSGRVKNVQLSEWTFDPTLEFTQHIFNYLYINKMLKVELLHKEQQQYSVLDPNLQIMWDALNLKLATCLNLFSDENIFNYICQSHSIPNIKFLEGCNQ